MHDPNKSGIIVQAALSALLAGIFSLASGVEREGCEEKGPCCDLDWTGQGATIVKTAGDVLVSQSPYVSAAVGMRVENGGRVMTLADSSAVVAFDDGCWHVLEENELLTVKDVSPCCEVDHYEPYVEPVEDLPSWQSSAAAAAAVAAAVIGGIIITDDDDDEPTPISR